MWRHEILQDWVDGEKLLGTVFQSGSLTEGLYQANGRNERERRKCFVPVVVLSAPRCRTWPG